MGTVEDSAVQDVRDWQALRAGQSEGLSGLFHRHYGALRRYGQKLTYPQTDLSEEIIQIVFCKLWERRATLPDVARPKVYLFRSFRNAWLDKVRHQRTAHTLHTAAEAMDTDWQDSPETEWLLAETTQLHQTRLQSALSRLPNRLREAVVLRYLEEMSYADLAEVMGVQERTAYNAVYEGLQLLRRWV